MFLDVLVKSGHVRKGQVGSAQVRPENDKSGLVKSRHTKSGQVRSCQDRFGQDRSS